MSIPALKVLSRQQGLVGPTSRRLPGMYLMIWILVSGSLLAEELCADTATEAVWIARAEANGVDVVVDLLWDSKQAPARATLEAVDAQGRVVSTTSFVPVFGAFQSERLTRALEDVSTHGFGYRLRIKDPAGRALASPHPFQVLLECSNAVCDFRLQNGVETDAVYLPRALSQALETIRGLGRNDIYNQALTHYPHLEGAIYTVAWQLDLLDQASDDLRSGPCPCLWMSSSGQAGLAGPDEIQSVLTCPNGKALETKAVHWNSARHYTGAQAYKGDWGEISTTGSTAIEMNVICESVSAWEEATVLIAGQSVDISLPITKTCSRKCASEVEHTLQYDAVLQAQGQGSNEHGTWARVSHGLDFLVDGVSVDALEEEVEILAELRETRIDQSCEHRTLSTISLQSPSEAILETESKVTISAEPMATATCGEAYVFAEVYNSYTMRVRGSSACAAHQGRELTYRESPRGFDKSGGVALVRWRLDLH